MQTTKRLLPALIIGLFIMCMPSPDLCEDCKEFDCIYFQINNAVEGEGSDTDIQNAIDKVIKIRGIKDSSIIKMIYSEYYL